jgi:hypothetical protein
MIYCGAAIDAVRIRANIDELDGNKQYPRWLKRE